MDLTQTAALLTVIASYDRRQLAEADVHAWHEALGHHSAHDCREAVTRHYRTSTDWLMPAHINRLVIAARNDAHRPAGITDPTRTDLVTMPDWFRASYLEHRNRARAERGVPTPGPLAGTVDELADADEVW